MVSVVKHVIWKGVFFSLFMNLLPSWLHSARSVGTVADVLLGMNDSLGLGMVLFW